MGHFPNLPSKQFAGKSEIGQYGDKIMEGDHHVGQILDALKELEIDDNTLLVFASDNGPQGQTAREMGNQGAPDMGNSGPSAVSWARSPRDRSGHLVRWPGKDQAGTSSHAMFSIMDFFPSFATLIGSKMPTDRPIDGVDQTDVLFGKSKIGNRELAILHRGGSGRRAVEAMAFLFHRRSSDRHRAAAPARHVLSKRANGRVPEGVQHTNGPHEDLQLGALFGWTVGPALEAVERYKETLKKYPNRGANITQFSVEDDAPLMLRWRQRWLLRTGIGTALALAHVVEADRLRYGRGGAVRLEHGLRLCAGIDRFFRPYSLCRWATLAALVLIWFARLPAEMLGRIAAISQCRRLSNTASSSLGSRVSTHRSPQSSFSSRCPSWLSWECSCWERRQACANGSDGHGFGGQCLIAGEPRVGGAWISLLMVLACILHLGRGQIMVRSAKGVDEADHDSMDLGVRRPTASPAFLHLHREGLF